MFTTKVCPTEEVHVAKNNKEIFHRNNRKSCTDSDSLSIYILLRNIEFFIKTTDKINSSHFIY